MMLGLSRIQLIIACAALAFVLTVGGLAYVFKRGEAAGSSAITSAVQQKTIQALDPARISKERTDEEGRRTPFMSALTACADRAPVVATVDTLCVVTTRYRATDGQVAAFKADRGLWGAAGWRASIESGTSVASPVAVP